MSANTNSSVIADQANAITSGITTQRDGLSRINNGLDDAVISTNTFVQSRGYRDTFE